MSRAVARLVAADRRMDGRMRARVRTKRLGPNDDDGFVLLETVVAISLISVVMAAFTTFFVNTVANTTAQRATQAATQLATSAIETIRALPATDLVAGHDPSSVAAQFNVGRALTTTVSPWLQTMTPAIDPTAGLPNNAGKTATIPTIPVLQTLGSIVFSVNTYLGTCVVPTGTIVGTFGSTTACGLGLASTGISYLRAVVTVTWTGTHCDTTLCTYITSTLVNADSDPKFNLNQAPPAVPVLINPGPQVSTVGDTDSLQLALQANTGTPAFAWSISAGALPAGLTLNPASGLISGSPTTITGSPLSVTVTVADGFGRTSDATFTWNVVAPPTITTPADQTTTINTPVSLPVASTCPNTPCTFILINAPVGLSIDNSGVITGTPILAGTTSVTVRVTDNDGMSAVTSPFVWTVLSPATVCVPSIALPNGSFEAPGGLVGPSYPNNPLGGTPPLLWDTTEPDNQIELWGNGADSQSANAGLPITAVDGTQWAELNANQTGALYQNLATISGQVLQWSVWHRARYSGNINGLDVMQVQIGSPTAQTPQVPTGKTTAMISDGPTAWVRYSGIYTVPAGQTTTRFQFAAISTASGSNSVGNFIDGLSLNNNVACLTSAVVDRTSTIGTAIAPVQVSVDRGTGPFVWVAGPTALPAGLALSSDGKITGTPTALGTTNVVLSFSDATAFTQSVSFTWTVVARPTITAPARQTSSSGAAVNLSLVKSCPNTPCIYTLNNGPTGLTVSATGVISGTITGPGQVFNAAYVTVTDAAGAAATSANFIWTVVSGSAVTAPADQSTTSGAAVSVTLATTCVTGPCSYVLNGGPAGVTVNSSGIITGTIGAVSTFAGITVTLTDGAGVKVTSSNSFTWTVLARPTITAPAAQRSTTGAAVTLALSTTCANVVCNYVLNNGPVGLTVSPTGVISGTITSPAATFTASVKVTDASGMTLTSAPFTWTVVAAATVTAPSAQTSTTGAVISLALTTSCANPTCAYVLTNGPSGLTINSSGVVVGTITSAPGAFSPTVTVTDSSGIASTSSAFTWTVRAPPTVTAPAAQRNTTGAAVSATLARTCANPTCNYVLNNGPSGVSINTSGVITGTITSGAQTFNAATVTVTDASGVAATSASFTWTVLAAPTITAPAAQTTTIGAAVNLGLTTTCANTPCSYVLNNGPSTLSVSSAGVITGTITSSAQIFNSASVTVTDGSGMTATTALFTWTVRATPTVTAPATQTTSIGATVSIALATTCPNSPCAYVLNNGPATLTVNASGVISGTITSAAGSFSPTLTVTDASGITANSAAFTWTVAARPTVTTPANQSSTTGAAVSVAVSSSCTNGPCVFSLAGAPLGVTINSTTGLISGTITSPAGPFSPTLTVTDASSVTATASFTWTVLAKATVTAPAAQTNSTTGTVNLALATTCPNTPCTYVMNNGPLGLTISATGVITGTITSPAGPFNAVTITVTDKSLVAVTSTSFSWTIVAKPTVTAPATQSTTTGGAVNVSLTTTCGDTPCSYVLNNGPLGLSISAAGVITGTITSPAGPFSPTVTVTDDSGVTATTAAFTWTVLAKATVTAPAAQTNTTTAAVSLALTTTCPNNPCSYVLNNGPAGLSISALGVVTGTITSPAQTFGAVTVTVTDKSLVAVTSASFIWTVLAKPTVTAPATQTTTTGAAVSLTLASTCPNTPCVFTLANAPLGLSINASGVISGTITSPASTFGSVTVTVTDKAGIAGTSAIFTWTVLAPPTVTAPPTQITTTGGAVNLSLTTTCGDTPCSYVMNAGPLGLSISAAGVVTGTVTSAAGPFTPTVTVTDGSGISVTSASFTWTVAARPTVTAPATQSTPIGGTSTLALTTTCANPPCSYVLNNGPSGLSINSSGVFSGTVSGPVQTFSAVTVTVTDRSLVAATSGAFTWNVVAAIALATPPSQKSSINTVDSLQMAVSGGSGAYTWAVVASLPAGLTLNTTTGLISGTPTTISSLTVSIRVTDNSTAATQTVSFIWAVVAKPTIGALSARSDTIGATDNVAFAYTCANAPCTLVLANAIPGLGLSTNSANTATNATTSLNVSGSGTVYINGTVGPTAVTSGTSTAYASSLTLTDAASASAATAATWTAYTPPVITDPGNQAIEPNQALSLQITATCPNGGCSYAAAAQVVGDTTWYPQTISSTGLMTYAANSAPAGSYTVRITVTDADGVATVITFPLVVQTFALAIPNQVTTKPSSGTTTVTLDVAALMSPLADGYTYTLSGAPSWLTMDANGLLTAAITNASATDTAITVTVTSTASATSSVADTFGWTIATPLVNPVWSVSNPRTAATGVTYRYTFTTATTANSLSSVTMTVPSGTAGTPAATVSGLPAGTISLSGNVLTYTASGFVNAGTAVSITVTGLTNTSTVGTYTSQIVTNGGVNGPPTVVLDSGVGGPISFTSAALVNPVWSVTNSRVSATAVTYSHRFSTATAGTLSSVTMAVPPGTGGTPALGQVIGLGAGAISLSGNVLTYTITNPIAVAAGTPVSIAVTGLTNTAAVGTYTSQFVTTTTGGTVPLDSAISGPISFTAGTLLSPVWSVSNSRTSATAVTYRYTYTTATTGNNLSSVTMTVPPGTTGTPVSTVTGFTAASATTTLSGNVLTLSFTPVYVAAATNVTITVTGMINTAVVGAYTSQIVTIGALSGSPIIALDSAPTAAIPFTTGVLTNPNWMVSNSRTSATAVTYSYRFSTATAATLSSVTMSVPPGTAGTPVLGTVVGLGAGTISLSGTTLTYSVTTPAAVAAGTTVSITVTGMTNTSAVGTSTSQLLTTTTTGTVIAPIDSAPSGPVSFTTATLTSAGRTVSSATAGASGVTYTDTFTIATGKNVSSVTMTLPPGTTGTPVLGPVVGVGAGTISMSGNVVTYTVTGAGFLNAGTAISIRYSGITNSFVVGTYTSQFVTYGPDNSSYIVPIDSAISGTITLA